MALLKAVAVLETIVLAVALTSVETMMVTVAVVPATTVPRLPLMTPPVFVTVPWLGVADTNVTPEGSTSMNCTLPASLGPVFATETV